MTLPLRISEKHKVMVIPHDNRVATIIPHAERRQHKGKPYLLVPHKAEETKLLRNLGYTPPSPILSQYDWMGIDAFESQKTTAAMLVCNRRAYVLNSLGTGKTLASLFAADYLMKAGQVRKALIVSPLSTLSPVWDKEIFQRMPHRNVSVVHGTKPQRLKALALDVDFYVINHDGLFTVQDELAKRKDIDLVIIDELAAFRNKRTRRWKMANKICKPRKFVWGMTGSPTPNAPTDAFGQISLITPGNAPRYFKQFQQETMIQITQFKWISKRDANDTVFGYMQPAVRFTRDQCFDLPPVMYSSREVDPDDKQKKAYKEVMTRLTAAFTEGEVTAVNEGVKMSKLLQIGAGYVYTTDRRTVDLAPKARLAELEELIDESEGKVIVYIGYKHAVDNVYDFLRGHGYTAAKVYGDTPKQERDMIFNRFQNDANPRVLVAHPQAVAHGLTLTEANTIVWYTPILSNETYEQACARITRPGQVRNQFIVHIVQTPMEKRVYNRLQNKQKIQGALLEMFKEQTTNSSL